MVEHGDKVAAGQWSVEEAKQSSTWRELHAVRLVLESFKGMLSNECIRWFTDNQNVVRIVLHGSRKPELQAEALSILSLCVQNKIRIEPSWIPREQNAQADYLSRVVDFDDWRLNPVFFGALELKWGPIQLTALRMLTTASYQGSIHSIGVQTQKLLMLSHVTGLGRIISGARQFTW